MANIDGNYANYGNTISDMLAGNASKWEDAAGEVGENLGKLEGELIAAYSVGEGDERAKTLLKNAGLPATVTDGNGTEVVPLEALQLRLKSKYERALRCYNLFTQMMENMHSTMMRVIGSIRPN